MREGGTSEGGGRGADPWAAARRRHEDTAPLRPQKMTFRGAPLTLLLILGMTALELASNASDEIRYALLQNFAITTRQISAFFEGELPISGAYRFFTHAALHGFLLHLIFNMAALAILGPPSERALGTLRYAGFFMVVAVAGAVGHWMWELAAVSYGSGGGAFFGSTLVGASGAIFGVLAIDVVRRARAIAIAPDIVRARMPGPTQYLIRTSATIILLNVAISFLAPGISGAAHIGGFLVGMILAPLLLPNPRPEQEKPPFTPPIS